jgi:hypothetical protein
VVAPTADSQQYSHLDISVDATGLAGNADVLLSTDNGATFALKATNVVLPYNLNAADSEATTTAVVRVRDTNDALNFGDSGVFKIGTNNPPTGGGRPRLLRTIS